jgi:hypothetical protein
MRISSGLLLCLLSASLVSGIAILDVPSLYTETESYGNNEVDSYKMDLNAEVPTYDVDTDVTTDSDSSGRRLLRRFVPKVIQRIFRSPPPPPPAPKPAPKAAPKPAPKAAPAPAPKAAPAPAPKAAPAPAPKAAPVPAPKPDSKITIKVSLPDPKSSPKVSPVPAVVTPVIAVKSVPAPVVVASPAAAPATALPIYFTCDNEFDMYVNGEKIGRGTSWTTTYHFAPLVKPGDVIAIDGVDKGGPAAFIGVFGGKVTKPSEWRCSLKESNGWTKNIFDDSSWTKPVSYGRNQDSNIWRSVGGGSRPNIPGDAEWLWTSDNNNHDRVFCRYFPIAAPAPVPVVVVAAVAPKAASPVVAAPAPAVVVAAAATKAATPVVVAAAPKAATPVVAAPAPVVVVAPTTSKQTAIDEIIATNAKTNVKLTKFQEKILTIMKETSDEQVKIETENRNNYNGVSVTLQNEQHRLESSRATMKRLYDESERLNTTIQTHYKKMIADTRYLETLDTMRPGFLKSLGELASHIQNVKTVVDNKLIKDEYKDEMVRLLTGIHFNTHNISGYVATAFVNHYNKYKNLIQKENADYSSELKKLTALSNEYKVQVQKTADIERERVRLQDLLTKLKDTLSLSVTQREEFDFLVKQVISIFDKKRC